MLTEEAVTTEAGGFFQGLKFVIEKADLLFRQRLGPWSTLAGASVGTKPFAVYRWLSGYAEVFFREEDDEDQSPAL